MRCFLLHDGFDHGRGNLGGVDGHLLAASIGYVCHCIDAQFGGGERYAGLDREGNTVFIPLEGAFRVGVAVIGTYCTKDNGLVALGVHASLDGYLRGYSTTDDESVKHGLCAVVFIACEGSRNFRCIGFVDSYFAIAIDGSHRLVAAGVGDR